MGRFVKDLCGVSGQFWGGLCYSSQKRDERACKLSVADCDQDVGGAIGDGGAGVPGGLGDLERSGEDGRRDGDAQVSRMVVAPLKGNKEEYYYDGTATVDCSRSLFPQAGSGACWWLERHRVVYER
jgi:hypothetical protein